jgi:hypothetical protein
MNKAIWKHYTGITSHKFWVMINIFKICWALIKRGLVHDFSKYGDVERDGFAQFTPNLKENEYLDNGYNADMMNRDFQTALEHHYRKNSHHPESHKDGIKGMTLLDQLEMLADWTASCRRQKNGDLKSSINKNADRFEYGEFYKKCLDNTAIECNLFKFVKRGRKMD